MGRQLGRAATARFEILGPLGSGGFGAVYEAVDVHSGQRLAIKELDNTSGDSIARFKHEFRALAGCHHPNLVALQELIEQDGRWLIVMELVPGSDLSDYLGVEREPAPGQPHEFDEGRLRSALSGMVEGLRALHGFGILHRDLKPSNVRVRPDGRAVLLDFGLATSVHAQQQSTHAMAVGTVRYMAPEQAAGKSVGPAADLYALGVCLFEALTGRAPFEGNSAVAILLAKQQQEAPLASSLSPSVPPDLDQLCARLLASDPAARPSAEEVLLVLGGDASGAQSLAETPAQPSALLAQEVFAGRERELEHLERSLAATHRGELRVVLVEGESGVGKSELVAEFLRRAAAAQPQFTALRGRCYENEQVSYKAFDGCIDELSKLLRRMPEPESAALLPVRAALLVQLFPVLRNVRALAKAPREAAAADPTARRLEAFDALAALLGKLAEERTLVLVVDDLQWADAESFRMLQALLAHNPPPPLLLVATIRPRDELESEVLAHVKALRDWKFTDVVSLYGLPREQAKELAAKLLGESAQPGWLDTIADESDGHPLFLSELVHYTRTHELGSRGRLTLDAALRARLDRLDPRARELLEVVALAARPHGSHVFARALSLPDVEEPARLLLAAKILRIRKGQELGCYHDRIRHSAVELISGVRRVALHRQLALALAESGADPAEQAHHWDLAGDSERAVTAYEQAVERALETLAFTRAEQLCARGIDLIGNSGDVRAQRLTVQRANALACAGRSREAAELFQIAADRASGNVRIMLRSSAAQQLVLSARLQEGLDAALDLLREIGVRMPRGELASLLRFAWDSLVLKLRGTRMERRAVANDALAERPVALDVLEQLRRIVPLVSPLRMLPLTTQYLRLAFSAGSRADAAYALTGRGWLVSLRGGLARALPYFERSRNILGDQASPRLLAAQAYTEGSARIAAFDYAGGAASLERAHELAREHCHDSPWLLTHTRYHLGAAWYYLGEHARLARAAEPWLAELRERNDVLGEALLVGMGHCFVRHLMADAPDVALDEHEQMQARIPAEPFSFPQYGLFLAKSVILMYGGGPATVRWMEGIAANFRRSALLRTPVGREGWIVTWILGLLHASASASGDERRSLLREARRELRRLRPTSVAMQAQAALITAQLDAADGKRESALLQVRSARARLESVRHARRHHALFLEGVLEGGESGRGKREQVVELFASDGFCAPMSFVTSALPLLPLLLDRPSESATGARKLLLGRYDVVASRSAVGAGSVVVARDVHTQRKLALKELVRSSGKSLERFKREFRALQGLHHMNLGRLDALLEHEGRWYIAMELVDGSDLLAHVRPHGSADVARLTSAIAGVARGLRALHEAGFVHRDLKPASIVATVDGRPVLLDFGSIGRVGDAEDDMPSGTAEYAAPEQLAGCAPQTSSDVYALGVCLYQGLLGRLPFVAATPSELLAKKRAGLPTDEKVRDPLHVLCLRMLAPLAIARPTLAEVLDALTRTPDLREGAQAPAQSESQPDEYATRFAGREEELAELGEAFESTCDDGFTVALVEGESGMGKSALVAEFAARLSEGYPTLQVLRGHCYENEQLAFKAFDGAVDGLARVLRGLSNPQCEALLPKKAALLAQLFPVLSSVPAIAQAAKKGLPADPAAQKLAAQKCFVELLVNLSARYELLFVVDDLQWADSESFALLHALIEERARLPLFFLCTTRPTRDLGADAAREIARLRASSVTQLLALEGLSPSATSALAVQLCGGPLSRERLAGLVEESKGHPLFLRALIAYQKRGTESVTSAGLTLDGALRAHIKGLSAQARGLLELVALAERPLGSHVYAQAMGGSELPRDAVISLLSDGLVTLRGESELACYHDRIRRVALELIKPAGRPTLAQRLASALEATRSGEPAERARLWDEAGERARAIDCYEQAGDRALESLAFARAEQHYARALALLEADESAVLDDALRGRLLEQRGHALVRAGRSAEAASAYARAAERASGEAQVRLRIWAAQHLVQSAQVDAGMRAASDLLAELGLSLPKSDREALTRMAWERAFILVRGSGRKQRAGVGEHGERLLLEALHGLSAPVRAISYLPGSALVVQYLRRALKAGDPVHTARALAFEGLLRTLRAPRRDQTSLFERSRALAESAGDPALLAEVELTQGMACLARAELARAPAHLSAAHELLQTHCPGEPWLLTSTRMYLGSAWFYTGEMAALSRHAGAWVEEARARDDRYALAALTGSGWASFRHVIDDRPESALSEVDEAMAPWPDEPFSTHHYGAFSLRGFALHYARPDELLAFVDADRQRRGAAYLMRTPTCRGVESMLTLLGIVHALERGDARAPLLARGDAELRALARNQSQATQGTSEMFAGLLAVARGDLDRARQLFARAFTQLSSAGNHWSFGVRYLDGAIEGGESGRAKCEELRQRIRAHGWADPERALATLAPGLRLLG